MASPGSVGDGLAQRHHVKPRHAKIVLPRNHSASGRNLAKLARQAQLADDGRRHTRQRSHEGDTEIRLPGSLDESRPPPMRRNMTATQLPRNTSHAKLKKNLSHGQLSRLTSGKNLLGMASTGHKAPPSPGLKGKSKRVKSVDLALLQRDRSEEAAEERRKDSSKRAVGFAVGSGDESSDTDEPQMEGSGLQEDEWTEESASVSPYSTRQNTANNSRRASVTDRPPDRKPSVSSPLKEQPASSTEEAEAPQEHILPDRLPTIHSVSHDAKKDNMPSDFSEAANKDDGASNFNQVKEPIPQIRTAQRSPLHLAKEMPNPAARHLLTKAHHQLPAPALISNVSALDDSHSSRNSPAASMRSSRSNIAEASGEHEDPDELISQFVRGTSDPSPGSGGNTVSSTPKYGGLHTPVERENSLGLHRDGQPASFQLGLASPGSTISAGSSGVATPATAQSRTELRMAQEKAMAEAESAGLRQPTLPVYKYDRRNETLKTYLASWQGSSNEQKNALTAHYGSGRSTAIFQGRFRAVNTELRVVQKYRDPVGESIARLKACKGVKWPRNTKSSTQRHSTASLPTSRSSTTLPLRPSTALSKSSSPPPNPSPLKRALSTAQQPAQQQGQSAHVQLSGGSERQKQRREVSFAQAPPETREFEQELAPDIIARQLWQGVDVE